MPPAGAQSTSRARMPWHRQLGHHATVLKSCRKGAIGIASPACGHHGATVMHSSRCHLDYSFQLRGSGPTAPQLCHQLPRRKARSIYRSKTRRASQKANALGRPVRHSGLLRLGLLSVDKPVAERDQNRTAHDVAQRGGGQVKRNARGVERIGAGDVGTIAARVHHGTHG